MTTTFAANSRFSLNVIYRAGLCGDTYHCTYEGQKFIVRFRHDINATLGLYCDDERNRISIQPSSVSLIWEQANNNPNAYNYGGKKFCQRALKHDDRRVKPILYRLLKSLETGAHNAVEM